MQVEPRTFPLSHRQAQDKSRYTIDMDRVRFGRALGIGARQAAKTLMTAAEAAAAENPSARRASANTASRPAESRIPTRISVPEPQVIKAHARDLKRSVWSPFARFSTVLWLEVTGVFFAVFALVAGLQVWKRHAALRLPPNSPDAQGVYVCIVIFAVFAYFTISSFVRANRRGRR
jgi:hypothetical protein